MMFINIYYLSFKENFPPLFFSPVQEFDLRCAIPLGIYRAAFNFGISGGIIFPWGSRSLNAPSYSHERFYMVDNYSPLCSFRGPTSILGFKARGLGLARHRRLVRDNSSGGNSEISEIDHLGGDLAVTAFADLSFDLPSRVLQEAGVHGHIFACTGSLNKFSENAYKEFSFRKLRDSFQSWAGIGIVIPTKLFRTEVSYFSLTIKFLLQSCFLKERTTNIGCCSVSYNVLSFVVGKFFDRIFKCLSNTHK